MEVLKKVEELLPKGVISRIELEGCEIVVYTKDKEFYQNYEPVVREAVSEIKKRIEVRPEKNLLLDQEVAKQKILEILPTEAGVKAVYFEPERSIVIIVAQKPGLVIGKGGETFRRIKSEVFWCPRIERVPAIKSDIVEGIRKMLHEEVGFRRKFLNQIGTSIFSPRETNRNWIRLVALGGFREVGRSCMLVETPKSKVLIDCGLNVGASDANQYPILQAEEFDYNELDAIVLSHAHLDHCGFLPALYERGYSGPTYMTTPTLDLATLLWLDYIDVMQKNASTQFYTSKGVKRAVRHAITLDYNEVSDIAPDVRLTFQPAGHILGSSIVHLHVGDGLHNLIYALDQKFGRTNLLDPAFTNFQRVETLVIESTYGGTDDVMPPRSEVEKNLMDVINKTMERNGICLIPSFSVERSQELMAILAKYGFGYPVYLDGMIWDANGIYTAYPEYLGRSMQRRIFEGNDPFLNDIFKRIAAQSDREKAWEDKPCVIISTSGMLVGGPAIEHLKHLAEDQKNTLIFVGYQCVDGKTEIQLNDSKTKAIEKIFASGKPIFSTGCMELRRINSSVLGVDLSSFELKEGLAPICARRKYVGSALLVLTEDDEELLLSAEHPVLTREGWKTANELKVGDKIWAKAKLTRVNERKNDEFSTGCLKIKLVKIKKIEKISFSGYLYDMTSLPHHNFLANGIVVHNCEGTMGRRIQKGWKEIPMKTEDGKTITLKLAMEIYTADGLSGHSDKRQLLAYIGHLAAKPNRIIVAHGEPQKATSFAKIVSKVFRIESYAPRNLEVMRVK